LFSKRKSKSVIFQDDEKNEQKEETVVSGKFSGSKIL